MTKRQSPSIFDAYYDVVSSYTEFYRRLGLYMLDQFDVNRYKYYKPVEYDFKYSSPWEMVEFDDKGLVERVHLPPLWPHLGE